MIDGKSETKGHDGTTVISSRIHFIFCMPCVRSFQTHQDWIKSANRFERAKEKPRVRDYSLDTRKYLNANDAGPESIDATGMLCMWCTINTTCGQTWHDTQPTEIKFQNKHHSRACCSGDCLLSWARMHSFVFRLFEKWQGDCAVNIRNLSRVGIVWCTRHAHARLSTRALTTARQPRTTREAREDKNHRFYSSHSQLRLQGTSACARHAKWVQYPL